MKITALTTTDIPACADAFIAAYNGLPWNYKWTIDGAIKYLAEYVGAPGFAGFIIWDDNVVSGAILAHTKTWWTGNQLMIDELFISNGKQGMGYGKTLLEKTEEFARANDVNVVTLMTNKYMPALHFYDKNDFTKVEQYIFMFKQLA